MSRFSRFLSIRPPAIWTYGFSVLSVCGVLFITRWPVFHLHSAPTSLFMCAIMISAWLGGVGPGLLAIVLSCLGFDYYFVQPLNSFVVNSAAIPRFVAFCVSAVFAGSLSAAQRTATESLRRAGDYLKETVKELRRTNEALQAESRERTQIENRLRQSEGYLAEAQRFSHTGSFARDAVTDEIKYASEEFYRVLGFDPRDGQPQYQTFLQRIHPDDQARGREISEKARREKTEYELDYRLIHPGGEIRDIHAIGHPVLSPSGDLVEFVGTVIDITERRRAEEERERLRQAQADLARVNRMTTMGELTASLAHEVNQPIGAAVTNASTCLRWLAGDTPNLKEARAAAMRVVTDGRRAAEIISRVRLVFKKGAAEWAMVDVNHVIREMIVLLQGELTRHDISVRTELAADLPHVLGDHVQLQQVMMNLIMNSIDAMKNVAGARELVIRSQQTEKERVLVSVDDSGVGLPKQHATEIFDAFFTTKSHGTGLGLRISRSIIESHGGRLWAADNSPRGASFCFTLPSKVEAKD
jgi:PAS domain S-box-containing protein